ncbi:MAG: hypothetical protein LHV69_00810 [Elusimicrobia bacterium]|nr:hypothetical protein [Candidatus Obscuribacterium magneticum]
MRQLLRALYRYEKKLLFLILISLLAVFLPFVFLFLPSKSNLVSFKLREALSVEFINRTRSRSWTRTLDRMKEQISSRHYLNAIRYGERLFKDLSHVQQPHFLGAAKLTLYRYLDEAYLQYGRQQNRREEILRDWIGFDPLSKESYHALARFLMHRGDPACLEFYQKAWQIEPYSRDLFTDYSTAASVMGHPEISWELLHEYLTSLSYQRATISNKEFFIPSNGKSQAIDVPVDNHVIRINGMNECLLSIDSIQKLTVRYLIPVVNISKSQLKIKHEKEIGEYAIQFPTSYNVTYARIRLRCFKELTDENLDLIQRTGNDGWLSKFGYPKNEI